MASHIERRKFLATLGGAAAWPLVARAQQPGKTPRVGYIRAGTPNNDQVREEFVRGMRDLGYITNPGHPMLINKIGPTAALFGFTYRIWEARGSEDFESGFALMRAWPADAVFVLDDASFIATRAGMAAAAARHRLPLVCGFREMAEAGCLFSYSVSLKDTWYRSASFVDKILKGAKPSDLPVQQATKFELVINLKSARALGFDISPILLARADEVIE